MEKSRTNNTISKSKINSNHGFHPESNCLLFPIEEQCVEAVGRRERERQEQNAPPPSSYLWGKNLVDRDESGKLRRRKWVIENDLFKDSSSQPTSNSIAAQMGKEGCGAPLRDPMGNTHAKISRNIDTSTGSLYRLRITAIPYNVM